MVPCQDMERGERDVEVAADQLTISTILSMDLKEQSLSDISEIGVIKVESLTNVNPKQLKKENLYASTVEIFVPFMIAGIGTIGAGLVLGSVEKYTVFQEVKALYILVPALLGLKGNLDMCLASRMSTQANLGNIKDKSNRITMIIGNVALVQVQAIVAAILVSIFAVSVSAITNGHFEWRDALLLATSGVLTATISCFTLDFVLIAMILLSHKLKLNPDNIATPFAASIGDVISLVALSTFARMLHNVHDDYPWVMATILVTYAAVLLPIWVFVVSRNEYTKKILTSGWTPVLCALVISGSGGIVLDSAVEKFDGYEVFQPIINGIGGNLVSVQASRISTMLHQTSLLGVIPPHTKTLVAPWTALIRGVLSAKTARILLAMSVPGQIVFVFVADVIYNKGETRVTFSFVAAYILVSVVQLMILLYAAHLLIHLIWIRKIDPDSCAIPYLTAMGDLLGSSLLVLAFVILRAIGQDYVPSDDVLV